MKSIGVLLSAKKKQTKSLINFFEQENSDSFVVQQFFAVGCLIMLAEGSIKDGFMYCMKSGTYFDCCEGEYRQETERPYSQH